jgi:hypothetical protein
LTERDRLHDAAGHEREQPGEHQAADENRNHGAAVAWHRMVARR